MTSFVHCKIDTGNRIESDKLQRQLLGMGYEWIDGSLNVELEAQYIFLTKDGEMSFSTRQSTFNAHKAPVGNIVVEPRISVTPQAFLEAGNYTVEILQQILANLEKK